MAAVLNRRTERGELVLGYVGREHAGPIPVALSLGDDPTFAELVGRVRSAIAVEPESDGPATAHHRWDAVVAEDRDPPLTNGYPFWLAARGDAQGVHLALHGSGNDHDEGSGEGLLGHLCTLLSRGSEDAAQPISALPVLTAAERHQLLVDWNATAAPYPQRCLHDLIAERALQTPERTAVVCGGERLSYRELDSRANRLAHHLIALGVERDVLVAISVERSLEMVVGLLGILKAGGAYVPVDPAYPPERQAFMLESSGAPVVVSQERLANELPLEGRTVVCLDRDWPQIAREPDRPPTVSHTPEQLAYVIYTSGSTGEPKGVEIPHRALVNFLTTMAREPGLDADDVLVAVTTLSFDIAGLELYLPLLVGAQVIIAQAHALSDPRALATLISESDATVMQATPTTWRMLLDSGWTAEEGLKALCGGEPLPV